MVCSVYHVTVLKNANSFKPMSFEPKLWFLLLIPTPLPKGSISYNNSVGYRNSVYLCLRFVAHDISGTFLEIRKIMETWKIFKAQAPVAGFTRAHYDGNTNLGLCQPHKDFE